MAMIGRTVCAQAANVRKPGARIAEFSPIAPAPLPESEVMNREWAAGDVSLVTGRETITPFKAVPLNRRTDGIIFKAVVDPGFDGSSLFVIIPSDDADIVNGTGRRRHQRGFDLAPGVDPHQAALPG